jgi:hypothetical protein
MRALLLLLLLAGCAAEPEQSYQWIRPAATIEELEADRGYCEAQAVSATRDIERIAIIIGGCMRGRGWTLVER